VPHTRKIDKSDKQLMYIQYIPKKTSKVWYKDIQFVR